MGAFEISSEDGDLSELIASLGDRIYEFNRTATEISDGLQLAFTVRGTGGEVIAGLAGYTWGGTCEIGYLWVDESHRGQGIGTQLLDAAETEARRRGCRQIVLTTHSFQAPCFYARFGFEVSGSVDDYPTGHQYLMMRKALVAE